LEGLAGLYTGFKVTLARNIVYNIAQWSTFPIALALLTGSADATPRAARAIQTDLASEMAAVSDKERARERDGEGWWWGGGGERERERESQKKIQRQTDIGGGRQAKCFGFRALKILRFSFRNCYANPNQYEFNLFLHPIPGVYCRGVHSGGHTGLYVCVCVCARACA
jgi:hypothetical protein